MDPSSATEPPAAASAARPEPLVAPDALPAELLKLEYEYLTQSSFQTDTLRNQFVQFYLVLVGVAASAFVGLAGLGRAPAGGEVAGGVPGDWMFSLVAVFIGLVGLAMLPIFARLRRVVIECLQGTVLVKRYVARMLEEAQQRAYGAAFLWDDRSVPTDEAFGTASFVLIFVFMMVNCSMFVLAAILYLVDRLPVPAVVSWSVAIGLAALTFEAALYRWLLARELRSAVRRNRIEEKWLALGATGRPKEPQMREPIARVLVVGGLGVALAVAAALRLMP